MPEYSYWDYERLSYIEARKAIYLPIYSQLVVKTKAYERLKIMAQERPVVLFDFDAYDYIEEGLEFDDVLNNPRRKMGHGIVLCALLRGEIQEPQ